MYWEFSYAYKSHISNHMNTLLYSFDIIEWKPQAKQLFIYVVGTVGNSYSEHSLWLLWQDLLCNLNTEITWKIHRSIK